MPGRPSLLRVAPGLICALAVFKSAGGAEIQEGWDFCLPEGVKPMPYAGLFFMGRPARQPEIIHEGYTFDWKGLNPGPGVYDFSKLKEKLEDAGLHWRGVILRLKCSQTYCKTPWGIDSNVPDWVLEKHKPPVVDMAGGDDTTYEDVIIQVAAPWHRGLQKEYLRFVRAFGESGIAGHPALYGLYVHGISTSLGEEFWFTRKAYENLAAAGMTPKKLRRAFTRRIRAWAKVFEGDAGKLAWVGAGWMDAGDAYEDYKRVGDELDRLAVESGLGLRGGGIEWYNQFPPDQTGRRLNDDGYVVSETENPFMEPGRYFGDENEVYDINDEAAPYMYRCSVLRSLEMGMSFLWTGDRAVALDPEVSRYFNLTAGKRPGETPDIWCYLREAQVRRGGRIRPMRNFERGLLQREADDFRTRPALFRERGREYYDGEKAGDWSARATDLEYGQRGIGLIVDPAYWAGRPAQGATLKVTYSDDGAVWKVSYVSLSGIAETESVTGTGDGKTKTATFLLRDFVPTRTIGGRFDLALIAESGNLTASFVRLIL